MTRTRTGTFVALRSSIMAAPERRAAFVGGCVLLFGWQAWALFVREPGPPVEVQDANAIVIEAFGDGAAVGQTFVPMSERLDGLTVWFRSTEPRAATVRCELAGEVEQTFEPLYRWTEAVTVNGRTPHTFAFPPVEPSFGRPMRFTVALIESASAPVGIEASAGDAMRPGVLLIDGREQWGDLCFRTRAATRFRALMAVAGGLPGPIRDPAIAFALLAIYNWAVMTFVYFMVVANVEEW